MRLTGLAALALLASPAGAFWFGGGPSYDSKAEDTAFSSASQLFRESRTDRTAAVQALEGFVAQFPRSPRAMDARFMAGEAELQQALSIMKDEAASRKDPYAPAPASSNPAALKALEDARKDFKDVVDDAKSGLASSAQYRLGEAAYDAHDWPGAIAEFQKVEDDFPKDYVAPEGLLGIVYADLAMENYPLAESNLVLLGETFPSFLRQPAVLYVQGLLDLHKGDYAGAEQALKDVKTADGRYYLGQTYLLSKRAYLAAAAFETMSRDYPDSPLREEAQFYIGDAFFMAEDYNGAIAKYQAFISGNPHSPLRTAALFRIGAAYFQRKDYVEARANFQSLLELYPRDFFAPLAQYFIAESYLAAGQTREALFAYTKIVTQYPDAGRIAPLARFKLAWCQVQIADYAQAAQTASAFVSLYPNDELAKDVYMIMANAQLQMGLYAPALASFQRVVDIAPSSAQAEQALFSMLKLQYERKAYDSIVTSYQFIFRRMPPSRTKWRSMSYLYAADAYLALNRVEEARTIYDMILKVYPDDPSALYAEDGLAWCYAYKGEDQLALEARRKLKDMLSVAGSSSTFSSVNELGIADSLFNQKSYDDAYQLYVKLASDDPDSPQAPTALYRAGLSSYRQRYYTQAIELWRKLAAQYPKAPEAADARAKTADTLFREQKYPEAVAAYRAILDADPTGAAAPLARLRLAQAAYNAKDDAAAVKEAQALLTSFPAAPEASDGLDLLESVFDRSPGMDYKAVLSAVIAANPGSPIAASAQFRLARRAFDGKDYGAAAAAFQRFSVDYTNSPDLAKAQFYLGESDFNLRRWQDAVPAYERLLANFDRDADTPLALFHLGGAYFALENYDQATRAYARLLEEYPNSEYALPAQFNEALASKKLGKLDLAQYAYQRYVERAKPGDAQAQSARWEIYQIQRDRKDFDGAVQTLSSIRAAAPNDEALALETYYREGEAWSAANRPDEAMAVWQKMRALKPARSQFRLQALIKLGEAYEKAGAAPSAVAVYEDLARSASGETARAAAARAAALRKSGARKPGRAASDAGGTLVTPDDAGQ